MKQLAESAGLFEAMITPDTRFVRDRIERNKSRILNIGAKASDSDDRRSSDAIGKILTDLFKDEKIVFKFKRGISKYGIVGGYTRDKIIEVFYNQELAWELMDDEFWSEFLAIVEGTIHHELIHRAQIAKARVKHPGIARKKIGFGKQLDSWKDYYGNPHEIMAYASSVYYEMLENGLSHETMNRMIRSGNLSSVSDVWEAYADLFSNNDPVMKKLLRYLADIVNERVT